MTRDQMVHRIRENLNDEGITFYSIDDLNESIQDAYDEVVIFTENIEKKINSIAFTNDTTYYDIPLLVHDYYRPVKLYHNDENRFIDAFTQRAQYQYRNNWETISGGFYEYTILGPRYIGFSGRSSNATGTFSLWYKAQAPVLSGSTVFLITDQFIELIELYSTADLLEQNQEFVKASKYWELYDPMLEKYRRKIQLLSKSDRVFTRI